MRINDVEFNADLSEILAELISQLRLNNITYMEKTKETQTHIMVQCPYHNGGRERRPSAGIRKSDGMFHCFACGEVHSLQEVISHCFGNTDDVMGKFGWTWLLKNFATTVLEERKDVVLDLRRDSKDKWDASRDIGFVTEEELDKYRYYHPYWKNRGIVDESIIELFDLGYDKETDCITFPVRDINGNCLFVARRSVKTKWFNYPKNTEKPLYGLYELSVVDKIKKDTELVIVESMLDALSFWQAGKYAVALNGLGSVNQMRELIKLPMRKMILATDNDEKGISARVKIAEALCHTKYVTEYYYPDGKKDANDCTTDELKNLKEMTI